MDWQLTTSRGEELLAGHRRALLENGSESGAVDLENAPITPDLETVIWAWPTLPPAPRTAVRSTTCWWVVPTSTRSLAESPQSYDTAALAPEITLCQRLFDYELTNHVQKPVYRVLDVVSTIESTQAEVVFARDSEAANGTIHATIFPARTRRETHQQ